VQIQINLKIIWIKKQNTLCSGWANRQFPSRLAQVASTCAPAPASSLEPHPAFLVYKKPRPLLWPFFFFSPAATQRSHCPGFSSAQGHRWAACPPLLLPIRLHLPEPRPPPSLPVQEPPPSATGAEAVASHRRLLCPSPSVVVTSEFPPPRSCPVHSPYSTRAHPAGVGAHRRRSRRAATGAMRVVTARRARVAPAPGPLPWLGWAGMLSPWAESAAQNCSPIFWFFCFRLKFQKFRLLKSVEIDIKITKIQDKVS
jgi:hypothetical protein